MRLSGELLESSLENNTPGLSTQRLAAIVCQNMLVEDLNLSKDQKLSIETNASHQFGLCEVSAAVSLRTGADYLLYKENDSEPLDMLNQKASARRIV